MFLNNLFIIIFQIHQKLEVLQKKIRAIFQTEKNSQKWWVLWEISIDFEDLILEILRSILRRFPFHDQIEVSTVVSNKLAQAWICRSVGRANVVTTICHRMFCRYYFFHVYIYIYTWEEKISKIYYLPITCLCILPRNHPPVFCIPLPVLLNDSSLKDVLSGFAAGATGTAMNCWTDVPTLGRSFQAVWILQFLGFVCWIWRIFPSLTISWLVNHRCLSKFLFDQWGLSIHCAKEGGGERNTKWFLFIFFLYGTNIWFFDKRQPSKMQFQVASFTSFQAFLVYFLPETGNPTAWFPCFL